MSRRIRMTMVYEFDWLGDDFDQAASDRLAKNFAEDPTGFVHPLEWDEQLMVSVEDITGEDNA